MMSYFIFVVWKSNTVKKSTVPQNGINHKLFPRFAWKYKRPTVHILKNMKKSRICTWFQNVYTFILIKRLWHLSDRIHTDQWNNAKKAKVKNKTTKHIFISSILLYKVLYIFTMWNLPWDISNTSIGFYLSLFLISFLVF